MTKVGEHITLDIIGTTQEYDPSVYENVICKIAKAAEVTILEISKYKFEPQGFTILALLAESHISFHTFPEKEIITSKEGYSCGTGDSFVNKKIDMEVDVVDMEAYAIAKVCRLENIEFKCFKYISDNADENADNDWNKNLAKGASAFANLINVQF